MEGIIVVLFIINAIPAFFIAKDADKRKMNGGGWFLIILILSFIGMILYFIVRNPLENNTISKRDDYNSDYKKCPECAESIKEEAKVCRFCGYRYIQEENSIAPETDVPETEILRFPLNIKITEDNTPLFSEDNNKSNILKRIQKGTIIVALSQRGEFKEWLKVKLENEEGYILKYDTDFE